MWVSSIFKPAILLFFMISPITFLQIQARANTLSGSSSGSGSGSGRRGIFISKDQQAHGKETIYPLKKIHNYYYKDNNKDLQVNASVTLIKSDLLIPGEGEPINNAALLFFTNNGTIIYADVAQNMPDYYNITETFSFPVIMPGLWDSHTHYGDSSICEAHYSAGSNNPIGEGFAPHIYRDFGCALALLKQTICAGVTSVRELGGPFGQAIKQLESSSIQTYNALPHYYYAQNPIGITGGHTDEQYLPVFMTREDYDSSYQGFGALCDGVPECLKKVRQQIRAQADVIKIMTSGGVLSAFDQPTDAEFSLEEAKAMVQEANRAGRVVAAHAHGADGIATALDAGVHTIEHGSYFNESLIIQAKNNNIVYVPTITITQTFNQTIKPPQYDDLQWAKGQEVVRHNTKAVELALKYNVTIATGTDCPGDCAQVGQEIVYLNKLFGVTPLKAIESATRNGPLTLGSRRAPLSGILRVGYNADIIALLRSPLTDDTLTDLANPDSITHVFKMGNLIKSPENGVCNHVFKQKPGQWIPFSL